MAITLSEFNAWFTDGSVEAYAWPGGYPIFYLASDGETLCPKCVTKERERITESIEDKSNDGWRIVARDINWEDNDMVCAHCNEQIESAYGERE